MLANLRGSRFVALSEVNDGEKLDEAAIKSFTGGDAVTCRHLYHEFFSYIPQAKLMGFGNYKPNIKGTDNGIWRRIHLVPFNSVISEAKKDPLLPEKLSAEFPGILAWAVRGCIEWQQIGLSAPYAIHAAVEEYRSSEDVFQSWLNECCSLDASKRSSASELINSFKEYSGWGITEKKFGDLLRSKNFAKVRSNGIFWRGISLSLEPLELLKAFGEKYCKEESTDTFHINASIVPTVPDINEQLHDFDF